MKDSKTQGPGRPDAAEIERKRAEKRALQRQKLFETQRALTVELLAAIGAPSLLVVDDEASPPDDYLAAFPIDADRFDDLRVLAAEELDPDEDPVLWTESVRRVWSELKPDEKQRYLRVARRLLREVQPDRPLAPLEVLAELLPPDKLILMEPADWRSTGAALTTVDPPPIVLFDQELGGYEQTGMELLAEYRRSRGGGETELPAGILSNEVTADGELTSAADTDTDRVPSGALMLISKSHLNDEEAARAVQLFRLTANLPHLLKARERVLGGLRHDVAAAVEEVAAMPPRVIEDLVYRSSFAEGAWEGETMARVAQLLVLKHTRSRELADVQLRDVILQARQLARFGGEPHEHFTQRAHELHQLENYVPAGWINALQLPVANGDIFQLDAGEVAQFFVLVAQPCDLVLRSTDGMREALSGRLLPVNAQPSGGSQRLLEFPLPHSPPSELPNTGTVPLKKGFVVDLAMLDLCWLTTSGQSAIADVASIGDDPMLTEGMDLRRQDLVTTAQTRLSHLKKMAEIDPSLLAFGVEQFGQGPVALSYDPAQPERWSYPLRRAGRLAPRRAEALLVRYSAAQARAAFEHRLDNFTTG